jgi:Ca2+/Na+ antiporter
MSDILLTVTARRPNYQSATLRIVIGFVMLLVCLLLCFWFIYKHSAHVNDLLLYLIIFIPFLLFFVFMRVTLKQNQLRTECSITENGLQDKSMSDRRFITWQEISGYTIATLIMRGGAPFMKIKVKNSRQPIIISSVETGPDKFKAFTSLFKSYFRGYNNMRNN